MPPTSDRIFATLARHERHQQRLVHGHQTFTREWLQRHAADDPELAWWLAAQVKNPIPMEEVEALPESLRLQARGWQFYFGGDYRGAAGEFEAAWSQTGPAPEVYGQAAEIALGLGKVYTRTGHWQAARDWLLISLQYSRDDERLVGVMQGYGALGEIFLRAGNVQAAHACMSNAYHVMPPGSGQQAKQLNYLASTLMRAGATSRAESLLMTSLHIAADQGDSDSAWHALARLQFLDPEPNEALNDDVLTRLAQYVPERPTPVAAGFAQVGRALKLHACGSLESARSALQQAIAFFGDHLPCEVAWAERLHMAMGGDAHVLREELADLLDMPAAATPPFEPVLDRSWLDVELPQANGFAWLLDPVGTVQQEAAHRSNFFI